MLILAKVLGFDILLDHKLTPHLLEVNAHPSLRVDFEQPVSPGVTEYVPSPVDMEIKLPAVKDTLRIIAAKIRKYDFVMCVHVVNVTKIIVLIQSCGEQPATILQ